ncbi:hypothetical protein INT45_005616 [Circinella minor]|uniref:Uncharacterized protein n=1 Tax=Circinella minor TaxID=1195481 RepID=A0A8H7SBT9_9FUNG|nr:hypothetical protein INT45_005616 [Circinella minor]
MPIEEAPPLVFFKTKTGNSQTLLISMKREIKQSYTNLYNGSKVSNQEESAGRSALSNDILVTPGNDLISKMVLTNNEPINILIKALVPEVAEDYYMTTPTKFNKQDEVRYPLCFT